RTARSEPQLLCADRATKHQDCLPGWIRNSSENIRQRRGNVKTPSGKPTVLVARLSFVAAAGGASLDSELRGQPPVVSNPTSCLNAGSARIGSKSESPAASARDRSDRSIACRRCSI